LTSEVINDGKNCPDERVEAKEDRVGSVVDRERASGVESLELLGPVATT